MSISIDGKFAVSKNIFFREFQSSRPETLLFLMKHRKKTSLLIVKVISVSFLFISLLSATSFAAVCVAPSNSPSAPTFVQDAGNPDTKVAASFIYSQGASQANGYLVVRRTVNSAPVPVNGTAYTAGTSVTIGSASGCFIEVAGSSTSWTSTGLTANTTYYFFLFAYNDGLASCTGGPVYKTSAPGTSNWKTCLAAPVQNALKPTSNTGMTLRWVNSPIPSGGYDYDLSTDNFATSVSGYPKHVASSGSNPQTLAVGSLSNLNTYYTRVRSVAMTGGCSSLWSNIQSSEIFCTPPTGPNGISGVSSNGNSFTGNVTFSSGPSYTGVIVFADPVNNIPNVQDGTPYSAGSMIGSAQVIFIGGGSGTSVPFVTQAGATLTPNATYYLSAFGYRTGGSCLIKYSSTWVTGQQYSNSVTTAMEELQTNDFKFLLSPNPVEDRLFVTGSPVSGKNVTVELYNLIGKRIYTLPVTIERGQPLNLNCTELPPGVYFIKINDGENKWMGRFIKQ